MANHTPGPWRVERFERAPSGSTFMLIGFRVVDGNGVEVCESYPKPTPVHVNEKNAALIAAAPELLAALKGIVSTIGARTGATDLHGAWQAVRAAITKAEGNCPNCDDGCKAEKFCAGCDQTICAGCYAEHNHDLHCHLKDHKACPKCEKCVECEVCECPEKK